MPLSLIAVIHTQAMGARERQLPLPSEQDKIKQEKITLKTILDDPEAYAGKEIVLEGRFRGWSGKCAGSAPITRSDWILEDKTGCIYVTGRIPAGVSVIEPQGEPLILSGKVRIRKDGKPILEVIKVRKVPKPPR
jgi:hypothetical protein